MSAVVELKAAEQQDLAAAIGHNCTCQPGPSGLLIEDCPAHQLYRAEQLQRLVFVRRYCRDKLLEAEWSQSDG